eukprot:scaffold143798_cov166-Phaeocystis_antarctica.AAC.1
MLPVREKATRLARVVRSATSLLQRSRRTRSSASCRPSLTPSALLTSMFLAHASRSPPSQGLRTLRRSVRRSPRPRSGA